jgi:hypothetical protein
MPSPRSQARRFFGADWSDLPHADHQSAKAVLTDLDVRGSPRGVGLYTLAQDGEQGEGQHPFLSAAGRPNRHHPLCVAGCSFDFGAGWSGLWVSGVPGAVT